ncbi:MAG: hypothetical protein CSB48_07665 [Proteobacteria bacterium]|nr:MAG: hypothetical protein CSB48_07665 [Pseudomonadota bacterium]
MMSVIQAPVRTRDTAKSRRGASGRKRRNPRRGGDNRVKVTLKKWRTGGARLWQGIIGMSGLLLRHRAWVALCLCWILVIVAWTQRDELLGRYLDHPVERLEIKGNITFLDEATLRAKLGGLIGKGFFSLDLYHLKTEVEAMSWVEKASIRRIWPNKLEYRIVEQVPVANWNGKALLNPYGEVFQPGETASLLREKARLPALSGPENQAKSVLARYAGLRNKMAEYDIRLSAVSLKQRGAWALVIDSGIRVELGKERIEERVDRLISVYTRLVAERRLKIGTIDTRYTNGVAISWLEGATETRDTGNS